MLTEREGKHHHLSVTESAEEIRRQQMLPKQFRIISTNFTSEQASFVGDVRRQFVSAALSGTVCRSLRPAVWLDDRTFAFDHALCVRYSDSPMRLDTLLTQKLTSSRKKLWKALSSTGDVRLR